MKDKMLGIDLENDPLEQVPGLIQDGTVDELLQKTIPMKDRKEQEGFTVLRRKDRIESITDADTGRSAWIERYNHLKYGITGCYRNFQLETPPFNIYGLELKLWKETFWRQYDIFDRAPSKDDPDSFANAEANSFSSYLAISYMFTIMIRDNVENLHHPTYKVCAQFALGPCVKISEVNKALNLVQKNFDYRAYQLDFCKSNRGYAPMNASGILGKTKYRRFKRGEHSPATLYLNMVIMALRKDGTFVTYRNTFGKYRMYNKISRDQSTGEWYLKTKSKGKRKRGRPRKTVVSNIISVSANAVSNSGTTSSGEDTATSEDVTQEVNQSVS